jgi:DNA-binding LacI/PurR family transcriptional regulator
MEGETTARRRPTIADIARIAGVSKGAVSYALNGQPGISAATRERIVAIADELGWRPNRAARALSESRAGACGLLVARPPGTLAVEPFFSELMSGIESELSERGIALLLQMVGDLDAEREALERWWAEHRVDGVLLIDLRIDDPRIKLLERLGMPAVIVGGPGPTGRVPYVAGEDARGIEEVVRYLIALGHRRMARVAGWPEFSHTAVRTRAFLSALQGAGIEGSVVDTDYSSHAGASATRQLLGGSQPPTAIIYDNDVMAIAGLGVAHEMGVEVPDDVSIVSFDDSLLCQVVHPAITSWTRDVVAYGATAARTLIALINGEVAGSSVSVAIGLTPRASTGPPRTPGSARHRVGARGRG